MRWTFILVTQWFNYEKININSSYFRSCSACSDWQQCISISSSGRNGLHKYNLIGFLVSNMLIIFHTLIITFWCMSNPASWNACRVNCYSIRIKDMCYGILLLWKCDSLLLFTDYNTIQWYCTLMLSTLYFYTIQPSEIHRMEILKCSYLINPSSSCSHNCDIN